MASHVFTSDEAAIAVLDRYKDYLRHGQFPTSNSTFKCVNDAATQSRHPGSYTAQQAFASG